MVQRLWGVILANLHPAMDDAQAGGGENHHLDDYERLKRLEEAKTNFLIVTAHELRTPLTLIKGYLELLKERDGSDDRIIRAIEDNTNDMISVVDDIVTIARMDLEEIELKIESVSTLELLDELIQRLEEMNEEWGDKVSFAMNDLRFEADRRSIEKVLMNLLTNALKYNSPDKKVEVKLEPDGPDHILITVKDNGEGIPDELKGIIFDEFFQSVDSPLTREHVGMGLGLSVTKRLVELHRGDIWVENNPEGGSIFYVRLPRRYCGDVRT
ncbi:MAG TPA: HAMP domain-containing histidine kinase [Candidatus Syntrophoarchaeum butanivorans]|uniref:histidine kinase n=1 Tax=Candidatus Syntropharchaeum butanivorans TaxID=1839936 RepID=A0A7C0X5K2_9EURY|nr:HAMP domain-containing histidine kinase [Candidatus Syntrophoarchaeum butanivorans]